MSLASQIASLASRVATEFKTVRSELASGLSGKANTSHTHTIANVTSLQSSLDAKAPIASPSFTGDVTAGGVLKSSASTGDEGGQIDLAKAVTNTTLTTGVSIDVFQNKLRFFETGGTNRGFYVDISSGGTSVGTNLAAGGAPSGAAGGDLAGTYPNPTLGAVGTAGTYTKVTTDAKGRVTSGTTLSAADIPNIAESQVTNLTTDLAGKAPYSTGTSFPGSPVAGQIFVNTTTKCSYLYNGSAWDELTRPNPIEPLLLIGI